MITGTKLQLLQKLSGNLEPVDVVVHFRHYDDLGFIQAPERMLDWHYSRGLRTYGKVIERSHTILEKRNSNRWLWEAMFAPKGSRV